MQSEEKDFIPVWPKQHGLQSNIEDVRQRFMSTQGFACLFLVVALIFHIVGLATGHWLVGSSSDKSAGILVHIVVGLKTQTLEYRNGTIVNQASSLNMEEEHYIFFAIACVSFVVCCVNLFEVIHIFVGISAFGMVTLLLICILRGFSRMSEKKTEIEEFNSTWPVLYIGWSFILVMFALLFNVVTTVAFLAVILVKEDKKASHSRQTAEQNTHRKGNVTSGTGDQPISVIVRKENIKNQIELVPPRRQEVRVEMHKMTLNMTSSLTGSPISTDIFDGQSGLAPVVS
ncbi:uncharacterized protein LOC128238650 [Mya arenaria]|uniref:uncharacterized protein LOC128238650 n=1 Tax=Mya arenaria TaxID=6604 RepID=UPI0022E7D2DC|nr:uncharacterized protein LOC128238650 [Mya arenaria]